jgi:hypothetical protein
MALKRGSATNSTDQTTPLAVQPSLAEAAIDRLAAKNYAAKACAGSLQTEPLVKLSSSKLDGREGTRIAMFAAALTSPTIAGLPAKDLKESLLLIREAAEYGVKYAFNETLPF